ncbi:hypothetical protein [Flavobacterium daemonense]|uniref:hypothetical protein n=1 Tax=Flavobacterium daemonense TaxID=1393049 RepID=UPI001185EC3F|nr:hypothetical protein [Flavobacterium daemonense]KAF2336399.1 hypothetical protein FND99_03725 [Flavobacterium daemonense]
MKISKFIFITLILLSFFGCKKKEVEKVDELRFEKNVVNNVFLEIVDSIYMDRRTVIPPPPPKFDFKTNKEDTIGYHAQLKKYWREQDSIKKDTTKILLGVTDLVEKIGGFDKEQLIKECQKKGCIYDKRKEVENFKFDLNPFKNNKKFNFQYLSKFPDSNLWDLNDEKSSMPVGAVWFSRILFNKTKTRGVLSAEASCGGGKCGRGFTITIENKSGKWHIKKIVQTWVS